ncbi:hypothetical protein ACFYYR_19765 [Streptomyces sp. NPDC001922]|uniref:hypothetical protein n=1 Tax=Streptomyces sp. NPDC001922 TaxID=3364624 RepID=UPI00369F339C
MFRGKAKIFGALASGAVLTMALASPASANGYVETEKWGNLKAGAGQAIFFSKGETVQLVDRYADGRGVTAYVGGRSITNRTGGSTNHNLSFPEGKTIALNVCLIDGDDIEDGTCAYSKVRT